MKIRFLMLVVLLSAGCTTTQHYTGDVLPWSEKAIVLTEFEGNYFRSFNGIRISAVEPSQSAERVVWDKSKLEFKPGRYQIKLDTWQDNSLVSTLLGSKSGSEPLRVLQYGYNPKNKENLTFRLDAGKIYVLHLEMVEVDGESKRPIAYIKTY